MPEGTGLLKRSPRDARCVVWHELGSELKPELLAALSRPGFSVVRCDDEFAAFAHVCRLARQVAGTAANAGGSDPAAQPPIVILLIVDPRRLRSVVSVVESLARYAPSAAVWMHDLASSPQLRTVRQQDVADWRREEIAARTAAGAAASAEAPTITVKSVSPTHPVAHTPGATEPPAALGESETAAPTIHVPVHPATDSPLAIVTPPTPAPPHAPARLLTDEELAMLLDIEPKGGSDV